MKPLSEKLEQLLDYQTAIKTALKEKGADVASNATLADFATVIDEMQVGGGETLVTINVPNNKSIDSSLVNFSGVSFVADVKDVKSIGTDTFRCTPITNIINADNVEWIGSTAFLGCIFLGSATFPNCTALGGIEVFNLCKKLSKIDMPKLKSIYSSTFYRCYSLQYASFPAVTSIANGAFEQCSNMSFASFDNLSNITGATYYSGAFEKCFRLQTLYLLGSTIATMAVPITRTFSSTPIAGYTTDTGGQMGRVYVRPSLVNTYRRYTNWIEISANIFPYGTLINFTGDTSDNIYVQAGEIVENIYGLGNTDFTIYNKNWGKLDVNIPDVTLQEEPIDYNVVASTDFYLVTYEGISQDIVNNLKKITVSYDECVFNYDSFPITIAVPPNTTNLKFIGLFNGYKQAIDVRDISSDVSVMLTDPDISNSIQIILRSDSVSDYLSTLIDGNNFETADGFIRSGSASYKKSTPSYGYIKFNTPEEISDDMKIILKCYVSSEENYDFGGVHIGKEIYKPNNTQIQRKTLPASGGAFIFADSGIRTAVSTYTYDMINLEPNTDYYLNFAYAHDASGNRGDDRFYIEEISFWTEG